ncbi:uncharacterized protein LOC131928693 [Physella acuta]|uniref:uncharacterized protein LOC131928693 n=1 Tax=Physella acuta TaxID=109671 RepID=UPI0027DCE80F|nr:uncharacterized protein LOC131928693 [Physella acuta]
MIFFKERIYSKASISNQARRMYPFSKQRLLTFLACRKLNRKQLAVVLMVMFIFVFAELGFFVRVSSSDKNPKYTPIAIQMLDQYFENPLFAHKFRFFYKGLGIDEAEVYIHTLKLRRGIIKQNLNEKKSLMELIHENPSSVILQIQIGEHLEAVREFLKSLTQVKYTSLTILVFVIENFNRLTDILIRNYDLPSPFVVLISPFCARLNLLWFPGDYPKCAQMDRNSSIPVQQPCENSTSWQRTRSARAAHAKHAWTWGANMIYSAVQNNHNFTGFVVHFDDTDILSPDAVYVLQRLHDIRKTMCPLCAISLKSLLPPNENGNLHHVTTKHNTVHAAAVRSSFLHGFSLGQKLWDALKVCSPQYCQQDPFNYRTSIEQALNHGCFAQRPGFILATSSTRLYNQICFEKEIRVNREEDLYHNWTPDVQSIILSYSSKIRVQNCNIVNPPVGADLFPGHLLFPKVIQADSFEQEILTGSRLDLRVSGKVGDGWVDPLDEKLCTEHFLGFTTSDNHTF